VKTWFQAFAFERVNLCRYGSGHLVLAFNNHKQRSKQMAADVGLYTFN
jgi:hypothetical protein